jgi:hypothetical protein
MQAGDAIGVRRQPTLQIREDRFASSDERALGSVPNGRTRIGQQFQVTDE